MRFLAGLLLLALVGCAEFQKFVPLHPYEPWKKEQSK
jgi:hypothetical protein